MHYRVTFEIKNCDDECGHPQATKGSFTYSYVVSGKDEEEAERKAFALVSEDFIPEHECACIKCVEYIKPTPSVVQPYKDVGDEPQART